MLGFEERGKTRVPGPHWWETSAFPAAPTLLPKRSILKAKNTILQPGVVSVWPVRIYFSGREMKQEGSS